MLGFSDFVRDLAGAARLPTRRSPRWRVEETRRRCSVVQTAFPAISGVLGALFVNFNLFNVIFI
jgi:hypothetical protein